jgi:hypothetical protein
VKVARTTNDAAVSWPAIAAAIGLLTAQHARSGDAQADIIGDVPPGQVITALAIIAIAWLEIVMPGDTFPVALQHLGLAALEHTGHPE